MGRLDRETIDLALELADRLGVKIRVVGDPIDLIIFKMIKRIADRLDELEDRE